ncbi:hypothetical protein AMAG_01555 [Allomyces macrogynus ATCC 38327]|uniref:Uncharacterized protein n=1 Tax=Allomyces macrogynus (strain ATCC 38327) TaxID=578462 RepID=A0A0L0RZ32_ALLM3|nr:hypothetical protein AMAG_01555 [Allomyces macrogynus ATCC 38327]|eukprot:KNE55667.1 hypothetical protein AMAG_01555 [Allomyces macrogynus ATCC 38327]
MPRSAQSLRLPSLVRLLSQVSRAHLSALQPRPFTPNTTNPVRRPIMTSAPNSAPSSSPAPTKPAAADEPAWIQIHADACKRGEETYTDPVTGYSVFTAVSHKKRGYCCGNQCRHCPYEYRNVGKPDLLAQDKKAAQARKRAEKAAAAEAAAAATSGASGNSPAPARGADAKSLQW